MRVTRTTTRAARATTRAARTLIKSWRWSCKELCAAISDVRWIWRVHVLIGRYLPSHCRRPSICLLHQLHHDVPAIVRWSSGTQRRPQRRPQRQRRQRQRRCFGDCSPVILSSTPPSTTTSTLDLQPLLLTTFQRLFAGRLRTDVALKQVSLPTLVASVVIDCLLLSASSSEIICMTASQKPSFKQSIVQGLHRYVTSAQASQLS